MTQARSQIVSRGQQALYHCVTRCVRRAWLCGIDPLTGTDHEQRKQAVEARIRELGGIFAVGIYAYAVMSNHLHVVLSVEPEAAARWSDIEVAERWLRLFPQRDAERYQARRSALLGTIDRYRERLTDLSWFMKCLDEHIARRANAEDGVTGRFWEGRFKCQLLTDERALAAAMAYVDLNPVRAGIANNVGRSHHTSVQARLCTLRDSPEKANEPLRPIAGLCVFHLPMTEAQYIQLVDYTGRQIRPDKGGAIAATQPPALRRLGLDPAHWTGQVKGIGSAYWRIVGSAEAMVEKAKAIEQDWMKGIGYARWLAKAR
jgi:REP element-mobilizing transposase RayT